MDLGLSQATVADARSRFGDKFCNGDASSPEFVKRLSEVIERFHQTERWLGGIATFRIDVSTQKTIFLPYFLQCIQAAVIDSTPARLHGETYEFMHNGPGLVGATEGIPGLIVDKGVHGISAEFPSTPGTLTFSAAPGDSAVVIRVLGYDDDGNWVTDEFGVPGELVTLADAAVTTDTTFSAVKGIQKALSKNRIVVTHEDETVLATLENWMTNPSFRCYRVLDPAAQSVTALCKRKPIPVHYDEDYLFPGDLSAIKLALYCLDYEEQSEPNKAQQYFREALELLNQNSTSYRGGAQETMNFEPWGPGISGISVTY